jgi:predicted esterase
MRWCAALLALGLAAQELPRGVVVERVQCAGNAQQSYALYLPAGYTPKQKWPILFCFDPGARAKVPVERFAQAAEKHGFVVVASYNSRNGPMEPIREALDSLLRDVSLRFAIDEKRMFAAGHSGGSRVALQWGESGQLAGVVACGAAFEREVPKRFSAPVFVAAGRDDFNYHELHALSVELSRRQVRSRFVEFDGGHQWLPEALTGEALAFLSGNLEARPALDSKEERRRQERYERLASELVAANAVRQEKLVARLKSDSAADADSPDRRTARQVLAWVTIRSTEESRRLLAARQYREAAAVLETAVLVHPESSFYWFSLAEALAGTGDGKRARAALDQAEKLGFRDETRLAELRGRLKK